MIAVKLLSGPDEGEIVFFKEDFHVPDLNRDFVDERICPFTYLSVFASAGYQWEVDYETASQEEFQMWFQADLAIRVSQALIEGRTVKFLDFELKLEEGKDPEETIEELEIKLSEVERAIVGLIDNESGVTIEHGEFAQ